MDLPESNPITEREPVLMKPNSEIKDTEMGDDAMSGDEADMARLGLTQETRVRCPPQPGPC